MMAAVEYIPGLYVLVLLGCLVLPEMIAGTSERCSLYGTYLTAELAPQNLTLSNYPESTPRFDGCHWSLTSLGSKPIKLVFHTFDITPVDYISISDNAKKHHYIGERILLSPRFYGLNPPPSVIYSMTPYMIVHMRGETLKNPPRNYSGFWLEYSTFERGSFCNFSNSVDENNNILLPDLELVGQGLLTFPNRSSTINPSAIDCTWRMKAAEGYLVKLTFLSLNLSSESTVNCTDFVEVYDDPFGTRLGKFCAGDVPETILSSGPYLAVRFMTENVQRSLFSVNYTQEKQRCSRIKLKASASTINVFASVGFPLHYPLDTQSCVHEWRLAAPEGYMVKLSFKVFDTPILDRVVISDGTEHEFGAVIGSYCPPSIYTIMSNCKPPPVVYSVRRYMWVRLILKHRSSRPFNDGISVFFTAVLPGSSCSVTNSADLNNNILLNEISGGVISTPKDIMATTRPFGFDCTWKIIAPPGHVVNLTFTAFGMEPKDFYCSDYFVAIYDTPFGEASTTVIDKLCGRLGDIHSRTFSSGQYLSVYYKPGSGKSAQERKFRALYSFIEQTKLGSCQKNSLHGNQITIKGQRGGMIASPDFLLKQSTTVYRVNCVWTIEVPQGQRIKVQIRRVSLDRDNQCNLNYILIGNGVTVANNASALAKMCTSNSKDISVLSSGQYLTLQYKHFCYGIYGCPSKWTGMYVVFEAVNSKSIPAPTNGCLIQNSFIQNNNIPLGDPTGKIADPNGPRTNVQCTWKITAYGPPDAQVKITFKPLKTNSTRRCSNGYLEIHDGARYKSPTRPLLCNGTTVAPVYSSGRHLWIRTRNDKDNSLWKGFELCYESLNKDLKPVNPCSVCNDNHTNNNIVLSGTSGVIQSPNYPGNYPQSLMCTWRIYPQEDKKVLLTFRNFSLRSSRDCAEDSVEISSKKMCGNSSVPLSFLLSDSPVVVIFKSNERGNSTGFHAEFVTVESSYSEASSGGQSASAVVIVLVVVAVLVVIAVLLLLLWKVKKRNQPPPSTSEKLVPPQTTSSQHSPVPSAPPPEVEMVPLSAQIAQPPQT